MGEGGREDALKRVNRNRGPGIKRRRTHFDLVRVFITKSSNPSEPL